MKRQNWTQHTFNLNIDPGWASNILSRVQDTGIRIAHHCKKLTDAQLSYQPSEGAWSIKQHIGHLIDLEDLHHKRLKEFSVLKKELTGADMSNAQTEKADHNKNSIDFLLDQFSKARESFIEEFYNLPVQSLYHKAEHPRLKVDMKPVDLMFFVAEHDDHHLASMMEIIKTLK